MELHITQAYNDPNKKDGTPITDRQGRQRYRARIKTMEKGDTFLTGFVYKPLQQGDVIQADVKQEMYNGRPDWRFEIIPNKREQAHSAQVSLDIKEELSSQTQLLRLILDELRKMNGSAPESKAESEDDLGEEFDVFGEGDLPDFN